MYFFIKLGRDVKNGERIVPIDFGVQKYASGYSNAAVVPCVRASFRPSVRGPCEHHREYTVACFFVKLGTHLNYDERMNPIDFGGQSSMVKVTMNIYGNKLMNTIDSTVVYFFIKLDRDVNHGERMDLIDFGAQRSRSQWTYMKISL